MYDLIYEFIISNKYASIFVLMFVFATETVMPFVGYAAASGHVALFLGIAVGTMGSAMGSIAVYLLARYIGQETLNRFIHRHGKWLGVNARDMERAGRWFDHNAKGTVFAGKFIPGARTAVSLSAGFRRMRFGVYFGYTLLGTAISSTLVALVGYSAKGHFEALARAVSSLSVAVTLLLFAIVLMLLLWLRHRRRR
jgi:membrane protein DedA with SNARE-associated domain